MSQNMQNNTSSRRNERQKRTNNTSCDDRDKNLLFADLTEEPAWAEGHVTSTAWVHVMEEWQERLTEDATLRQDNVHRSHACRLSLCSSTSVDGRGFIGLAATWVHLLASQGDGFALLAVFDENRFEQRSLAEVLHQIYEWYHILTAQQYLYY